MKMKHKTRAARASLGAACGIAGAKILNVRKARGSNAILVTFRKRFTLSA